MNALDMYYYTYTNFYQILGNHTFAAIRGTESYSLLSSLKDVLAEINSLIKEPVLNGKQLRVVFGGDYKVKSKLIILCHMHFIVSMIFL